MPARLLVIIVVAFVLGSMAASLWLRSADTPPVMSGKALIGGPFALVDQNGQRVTEQTFRGKYMLVVFGYTYCPDICPAELQTIANVLETLGSKAEEVTPVFITIDPERDTVEQVAGYVKNFHPRFVGLTGTPEEIRQAARSFRVYYGKADGTNTGSDYLMDHSAFIYLMNRSGEYLTHFAYGATPEKIAEAVEKALKSFG
jgi:protein SCO1/2